jgi:hypothetical protein
MQLYYDLIDLAPGIFYVEDFTHDNALSYLKAFSRAYGTPFDSKSFLLELESRGFSDFAKSPLMLTLACILKTSSMPSLPRNTIGLVRRAIDTLTFRWDEVKGIYRDSRLPLDGEERIRCLMRVAYHMKNPEASEDFIYPIVLDHLRLAQCGPVDPGKLLLETAQWYGLLVPIGDLQWSFVHRTVHDFLAARFWVESGRFAPSQVDAWNTRAAYAACLVPDATASIIDALRKEDNISVVAECLYNNAIFDVPRVAASLLKHFSRLPNRYQVSLNENILDAYTPDDIFGLMSDHLVEALLDVATASRRKDIYDLMVAYTVCEFWRRGNPIPSHLAKRLMQIYSGKNLGFKVYRGGEIPRFTLADVL